MFLFLVRERGFNIPDEDKMQLYLIEDNWNDMYRYRTMYSLCYRNLDGEIMVVGSVKIGQYGRREGRPEIPREFNDLNVEQFFSLGQGVDYYEALYRLGDDRRYEILNALNDVALHEYLYKRAMDEDVFLTSLTRSIRISAIKSQFRRLANGNAVLTRYGFVYHGPNITGAATFQMDFNVQPHSNPPTNMHIIIGRNAVGKTHLLNNMIKSLINEAPETQRCGEFVVTEVQDEFENEEYIESNELFANVVSVSFSAFDQNDPHEKSKELKRPFTYIGLKQNKRRPKTPDELTDEFADSFYAVRSRGKGQRWLQAMQMLSSDPIFDQADVGSLLRPPQIDEVVSFQETPDEANKRRPNESFDEMCALLKRKARALFHPLSSGHKIVLLTLTRLVETVEERTLVFLDEPESHLHPPLLSAFTRTLSHLLIHRNGVAIIATHSPVILQEVPRSCVWKLHRSGTRVSCKRTNIETFGESIGALTSEVFELEVMHSGFYKMLQDAVRTYGDYDTILEHFNDELGWEARSILRSLLPYEGDA
ncbi:AAA family ATPase [Cohnella sp. GCM10027633]|uniref:AAA family ATPase n=1 Tax=unclassified Cohnella TaxID=2636738 RepID=UPI00362ADD7B